MTASFFTVPAFLKRGRLQRQILLNVLGLAIVVLFILLTPGQSKIARASLGTAYAGLFFLAASLIIGPLNVILKKQNPPSSNLRRDVGITAGIFAVLHVVFGLQVHFGGDILTYFFHKNAAEGRLLLRLDPFGIANHTGLLATVIFLFLLALSNNVSLRALRVRRWKSFQRWNYAAALLVIVHSALYQLLERRHFAFVALFLFVAGTVVVLQLVGFHAFARSAHKTIPGE